MHPGSTVVGPSPLTRGPGRCVSHTLWEGEPSSMHRPTQTFAVIASISDVNCPAGTSRVHSSGLDCRAMKQVAARGH